MPRRRFFTLRTAAAATALGLGLGTVATVIGISQAEAAGRLLMVSTNPDRSNAREVAGAELSGRVYVFVKALAKTTDITFYVDKSATPISVERSAPWDLATTDTTGLARPYDMGVLKAGTHSIRYRMNYDGKSLLNGATFTVKAATGVSTPVETAVPVPSTPAKPVPTTPATTAPPVVTVPDPDPVDPAPPAGGTSGAISSPTNLDPAGASLPDTNYAIPSGAVFLSTTGSDTGAGTQAQPFRTLNKAVSAAPAGGTIVIRGGTYRDGYTANGGVGVVGKQLTFQAYPHEQVWFSGTDTVDVSQFQSDGAGHWYLNWNTPAFCMNNYYTRAFKSPSKTPSNDQCAAWDASLDSQNPMAIDPQMVFADGSYVHEVASLDEAKGSNFYYQQNTSAKTGRVYLGFNPSGHKVELTRRSTAMVLGGNNSKLLGIGFTRFASNPLGQNTTGAIYTRASGLLIENSAFTQNAGPGFSGSLQNSVVRHSIFVKNGRNGITSNGHYRDGTTDNALIENSLFSGNNYERFDVGCSANCGAANIKLNHTVGFTVRNNIISGAQGNAKGVWCDLACTNGVIVNNLVDGNGGHGIHYEVSDKGIIASNMVRNNKGRGIAVGSSNTKIYNNTLIGQFVSMNIYDDARSYGVDGWTDVGPNTTNVQVANNVVSGTDNMINCGGPITQPAKNKAPNTGCSQIFSLLDYNSYYQSATNGKLSFKFANLGQSAGTQYKTLKDFTAAYGLDSHSSGSVSTGGADPLAAASGAGVAKAAAVPALGASTKIPSDVASAIGITDTAGLSRGAISWPGK